MGLLAPDGVLRRNFLALLSLTVAIASMSYNTWRNQTTESHRNVREAAFRIIEEVGELQQLIDARYYGGDTSDANRISGWGKAVLIRDMGVLVSAEVEQATTDLFNSWQANVEQLDKHAASSEEALSHAIAMLRSQIVHELRTLN